METPSRHSFTLNGSTRVFPIPSPIKGDNYCRLEVDGVIVNDRTKYDIVNNSIVFVNAADVPAGSQLDVLVVQSEEALGQLSITTNIDIVASNIADVNTVSTNIASVNTVSTNITNVNAVSPYISDVTTVSTHIADVTSVATNMAEVLLADTNAATATTQAGIATTQASNASTSATNASNSASAASTSATNASNSANAASASATAASGYASSASTFATNASNSASAASTSASNASTSETNAGNSATAAATSADEAAASAASIVPSNFVAVAGDSMTGNLSFGDNNKAIFGTGSDLQIYHDGTDSVIKDKGTGNLVLTSNGGGIFFRNDAETETYANFNNNGSVQLRYDNGAKLETTATGVAVTGRATSTQTTDNDLSFDMSAANMFKCTPTGTGTLTFTNITAGQSGNIWLDNSGGHAISAAATTYISSADLTAISTAGVYFMSYYADGTNVLVSVSRALTSAGA